MSPKHQGDAAFYATNGRWIAGPAGLRLRNHVPSKPWMRKCPQREGKSASAILLTVTEDMLRL